MSLRDIWKKAVLAVKNAAGLKEKPAIIWVATEAERKAAANAPAVEFPYEFALVVGEMIDLAKANEILEAEWPDEWFDKPPLDVRPAERPWEDYGDCDPGC